MPAVAGSRSRVERTISVRPPLSSVMSRRAATLTRSSDMLRLLDDPPPDPGLRGAGTVGGCDEGGGRRPGSGIGSGIGRGNPPRCPKDITSPPHGNVFHRYGAEVALSMPIA